MSTDLKKIAAGLTAGTRTAARAALKAAGWPQTLAAEVLAEKAGIDARRHLRRRAAERLPAGTPAQRLEARRREAVVAVFTAAFRQPRHGGCTAVLTTDPARVGVAQSVREDWTIYARSYTGGPALVRDTELIVPATWRTRVQREGLALVDGLMTLDASALPAPAGVRLYAAVWAAQGAGLAVRVERGFLALAGDVAYHAASSEAALHGVQRKQKLGAAANRAAEERRQALAESVEQFARRFDWLSGAVSLEDARAIGACEYGIRSWCHATGLDYESGSATIAAVVAAFRAQPRAEARLALLRAARRSGKN